MIGIYEIVEIVNKLDDRLTLYNCLFVSKKFSIVAKNRINKCYNEYQRMMEYIEKPIDDGTINMSQTMHLEILSAYEKDKISYMMNQWGTTNISPAISDIVYSTIDMCYQKYNYDAIVCTHCYDTRHSNVMSDGITRIYHKQCNGALFEYISCNVSKTGKNLESGNIYTFYLFGVLDKN